NSATGYVEPMNDADASNGRADVRERRFYMPVGQEVDIRLVKGGRLSGRLHNVVLDGQSLPAALLLGPAERPTYVPWHAVVMIEAHDDYDVTSPDSRHLSDSS